MKRTEEPRNSTWHSLATAVVRYMTLEKDIRAES